MKVPGGRALIVMVATNFLVSRHEELVKLGVDQLQQKEEELRAKKDYMAAILTQFRIDLDKGEQERVLLKEARGEVPTEICDRRTFW